MSGKVRFTCKLCDRTFGTANHIWSVYTLYEDTDQEISFEVCYECTEELRKIDD